MKNKKIVVFSENNDQSTEEVMRWCKIKGYGVHRINSDDMGLNITISAKGLLISTSFDSFTVSTNTIFWFRRAEYASIYVVTQKNLLKKSVGIFNFIECRQAFNALKSWVKNNCNYSSEYQNCAFNKVDVLLKAAQCEIMVPDWIVTGKKEQAVSFAKYYSEVACKPFDAFFLHDKNVTYKNLTRKLTCADLESFPNQFVPRFFQQYINKKYELRSFYFHGDFFTHAIFSQNNPETAIDFRNYDNNKPNRCIPFRLAQDYCTKLKMLMDLLALDTGSFDLLVDKDDNYYFLEVNPVGQFGAGSYDCNMNIEEHIANFLIEMSHGKR